MPHDSHQAPSERRPFPGWPWVAVALVFPIVGYIAWKISGPVDTVETALIGGALTGAGLAAVQWWAAKGGLGRAAAWISSSAAGGLLLARFTPTGCPTSARARRS
jgi:hypothetical protein